MSTKYDLFNPTEEHSALRDMLRNFVETEVDPQVIFDSLAPNPEHKL
jgi:hypothetical protein